MTKRELTTNITNVLEKKIGSTTYIVTTRFNGDKRRDIATALIRLIGRDTVINMNRPMSKIGA